VPILETRGLRRQFGGLLALGGVDVTIEPGEIVGLIGPNGSGKTTFFNVVSGLFRAHGGSILFGDPPEEISHRRPDQITRRGIARTFQNLRLFEQMTVLENVLVGARCRTTAGIPAILLGLPGARAEQQRARAEALDLLGFFRDRLVPRAGERASALSYANRRRLEIVRALATHPKLLLLDEPAAGMNPAETRELMEDIARIRERGVTVLLIEHDMHLVKGVCTRVVAFDHGVKIAEGDFATVQRHPDVVEAYLGKRAAASA
jgi:ABC-type branched-subunit amino acid transport system ATPase component